MKFFLIAVVGIILGFFLLTFIIISYYTFWFFFSRCKNCGHIMLYRGFRNRENDGFHLFHCKHCGNWEKVSTNQFLQELGLRHDNDLNED